MHKSGAVTALSGSAVAGAMTVAAAIMPLCSVFVLCTQPWASQQAVYPSLHSHEPVNRLSTRPTQPWASQQAIYLSLISHMFSVDVKHPVYLLVSCYRKPQTFVYGTSPVCSFAFVRPARVCTRVKLCLSCGSGCYRDLLFILIYVCPMKISSMIFSQQEGCLCDRQHSL